MHFFLSKSIKELLAGKFLERQSHTKRQTRHSRHVQQLVTCGIQEKCPHGLRPCVCMQAVLLQCLDALCQYSEQVVQHHRAVMTHLLPALATAVGRPAESKDSRFLCLKLLCDVLLHFLLETDLYAASADSATATAGALCKPNVT